LFRRRQLLTARKFGESEMRNFLLPAVTAGSLVLGGCAASIAAGVAGAALRSAGGDKSAAAAQDLGPAAQEACGARASQHGEVKIIDMERRGDGKIVIWGTSGNDRDRQSFECRYDGKIAGFKLRPIPAR
jgi:hypothetical protein